MHYITIDGDAYYQKGEGKPQLVAGDIQGDNGYESNYYGMYDYYNKNRFFYYLRDDIIYMSNNANKGAQVKGVNWDSAYTRTTIHDVYIITTDMGIKII